jgi:mannose-1-phosphate guanylyltransferase
MMGSNIKAVVLASGLGTRLQPYTLFLPKPMLPLGDKPVLEHLILWLKDNGIGDIILCVSYLRRIIEDYFRNGKELGVKITYIKTNRPMGTAGQLKSVEKKINDTFMCIYGDSIFNFSLKDFIDFHRKKKALATLALVPYKTTLKYGFIDINTQNKIKQWREKPSIQGLINIGCYIMDPKFLKYIPKDGMFGMDSAFERAIKDKAPVYGYQAEGDFMDIGDKRSYIETYKKFLGKLGKIP